MSILKREYNIKNNRKEGNIYIVVGKYFQHDIKPLW